MAESYKTKNSNTFRFKSFSDRVTEIDIRRLALYHIGHENEELPEDNETYFHQTLKKWMVLNLSDEFGYFSRKCLKIVTLPQLIHQKDFVVDLLLERLATATNLSLQPLLELLYVLARDLREEFYAYFQRVLDRLICLLNTADAEELEWTLVCLAYLFKTLKPYLKKNIGIVFHAILPLLDEQRYEEHVTNFAVECFAFIARDVRDYRKFLDFILATVVREQVQSIQGCGRLLFEIMRGTTGQFHSIAGDFLHFIFESLVDDDGSRKRSEEQTLLLFDIVQHSIAQLLRFINPANMTLYWTKLCDVTMREISLGHIGKLRNLIALFLIAVQKRDGRYVCELDVIVQCILKMIEACMNNKSIVEKNKEDGYDDDDATLQLLALLVSKILLSSSAHLTQLDTSTLLRKVLSVPQRKVHDAFVMQIVMHSQFEMLVLPVVIVYFERHFDFEALDLMSKILLSKQSLARNATALKDWKKYEIKFKKSETLNKIQTKLENNFVAENLEEYLLLLILAPHLCGLDCKTIKKSLQQATLQIIAELSATTSNNEMTNEKNLILLTVLLETQTHLQMKLSKDLFGKSVHALLSFACNSNLYALGALDLLFAQTSNKNDTLLGENINQISRSLAPLLGSHSADVRQTVAHCLQMLHSGKNETIDSSSPYKIFYEVSCIRPDIRNYREQLMHLQRLETAGEIYQLMRQENGGESYKLDILRFLFGLLYENFKFIWAPVQKLIEEYSHVIDVQEFWVILKEKLLQTSEAIDYTIDSPSSPSSMMMITEGDDEVLLWNSAALNETLPKWHQTKLTQKELLNYRNLLWMRLPQYGQVAQVKNRDLVPIFLEFVNVEYRKNLEKTEFTIDLSSTKEKTIEDFEIDNDEDDNDDHNENADHDDDENDHCNDVDYDSKVQRFQRNKSKTKSKRKLRAKQNSSNIKEILQAMQYKLATFAAQPNPRALYREPELYALYMELLAGPNAQLQKLALDCVFTYKAKPLMPYKESLYAFVDELKFKDELINFKLSTIQTEYREDLMHILLRILYGKMITKGGAHRNLSAQQRKSLILRFLAQCSTSEIFWFLRMAFGKYAAYTDVHVVTKMQQIPEMIKNAFQLNSVWAPKKLQSIINLLELIRKEFGGLMNDEFQIYMLNLLTFVGSICNEVHCIDAELMHPKIPVVYRNVRNAALISLVNFFGHIEQFNWQAEQIACLTNVFIWPAIEKLPNESIHTPTALLKLLLEWGEKPQHFAYLQQKNALNDQTIFHYIIALLLNDKAKPAVRRPILTVIERLLIATTNANVVLPPDQASDENRQQIAETALSIIKPYIADILKRLKMNFSTRSAKHSIDKRDLNILSMLTQHVSEPETCDSLLQLLLPILISKSQSNASEEVVCQVITTLSNLIRRLAQPELYLRKIAPLFEQTQDVPARKMLCQLIADIAKKRHKEAVVATQNSNALDAELLAETAERLKKCARLVLMLNAWDKRWVEQPDYERRLDALKEIKDLLSVDGVDMDLGILIIYNCFYFLKYDKDMGLRDNASEHLQLLLPKLALKYSNDQQELDYLIGDVCVNLLRRTIRDANDNVRSESIRLLGVMARECPTAHNILSDLSPLTDRQDMEVDFFENIIHLQSHRHGRALLKFCSHAETLTVLPNVRTLTQFMLPLASRYLLNEKHASKHTLVDAAIETVGVVCQLLPWSHYHTILRYYLMKMRSTQEHQKQCVRIVVRILDAFHFDLSQAKADDQVLQQLKKVLSEKLGTDGDSERASAEKKEGKIDAKPNMTNGVGKGEENEGHVTEISQIKEEEREDDNLDAELDKDTDDDCDDEKFLNNKSAIVEKKEPIMKKPLLLPPNASKRVMITITTILIPTLNRAITEKSSYDMKHKVNRKRLSAEREEEEILRVPIALALVKLMQKLPKELLDSSLSGVFMKVCTFLRSPLKSVRMLTRDILKKIMLTLGASYLSMLMDHLQNLLTRGFQVHVLAVTVHGVLDALRDHIQPADIESCLHNLLDVALNDIFGEIAVEKEIEKITAHAPEAKPSAKSFLVLHIAARNIQESCLLDLLMPFKEHLARSHSRKMTMKIQECFAKIVAGLVENIHISRESLLIFIYGTMSESITDLIPGTQRRILSEQEKEKMRRARPDCFLIQPAPARARAVGSLNKNVKSNAQANAHILIEFGLEMLHIVLRRKKLLELDYQPFLNPMLPLLRDSLKSTHVRVTTFALKCFATVWTDEYRLPALQQYLDDVVVRMFEILKNFSTFGATRQEDNFQLIKSAYKAIVALLRKCKSYNLSSEQIDQLILYIEQHLHEGENQDMAFTLLKALVSRKVNTPAMSTIMKNIGDLSIVSHSDFVRDEARSILVQYVMEYTLKKRLVQTIKFFTVQLRYTHPTGRQSAIKFLHTIIKKFPADVLAKQAEFLYLSLGTRLVNDDDPDCRKAVAECIELLITRLEKVDRQSLFDITLLFFQTRNKPTVREMAASLCSRFLMAEKQLFGARLKVVLPIIVARLTLTNPTAPGRFVRAPAALGIDVTANDVLKQQRRKLQFQNHRNPAPNGRALNILPDDGESIEKAVEQQQREIDHEIIQMQYCLLKMFEYCDTDMLSNEELNNTIDELAYESQKLLGHEHTWVRCNAAKIIAHILAGYDFAVVGRKLSNVAAEVAATTKLDFIYLNPEYDIKSLVLDLCAQMIPGDTPQTMIDEIVKIFLYIANMLRDVPCEMKKQPEDDANVTTQINLNWLVRQIRFLINKEVAKAPHCIAMRSALFTLIEGLTTLLCVDTLVLLAPSLLAILVREMNEEDQNVDAELRQQALRVGSRLRKRITSDVYDKLRTGAQTKLMIRRAERRKIVAQEKIQDPVRAAKRKVGMQERKKASKRRKADVMRGKAEDVKNKLAKRRKRKADDDIF